ncbi:MAG: GH3 auxin-responsive promoter family protein [Candidatus Aureabacteria bacterium]|nr:GH3 auxin-responsive promoter family protein [Candidatus Auribacterota bacterium]
MHKTLLTPVLYGWARLHGAREKRSFERSTARCADTQRAVLKEKLRYAEGTEYGRRHLFSKISSPGEYRKAVPIVDYAALAPHVERIVNGEENILFPAREKVLMFAMTSGTTAAPKYVPVTQGYYRELSRGNFIWGVHLMESHRDVLRHKILHIVSPSRECTTARGVACGAATGLVAESQRMIARLKYALPPSAYRIADYDTKYYTILRIAMEQKISLVIAANPSTLVALGCSLEKNASRLIKDLHDGTLSVDAAREGCRGRAIRPFLHRRRAAAARLERAFSRTGRLIPKDIWPELEVIACWTGGTLTPYLDLVKAYWGDKPLRDPGLIASEGRMTIPIEDGEGGGVLDVMSHFYEFLPYEENGADTLLAHELEVGKNYYILLTTSSGFFRYNISDVVQVTGYHGDSPVLKFLHKGSRISSLTGEKISEHQVVEAFRACERALGFSVPQFNVCPRGGVPPSYYLLLEEKRELCNELPGLLSARFDDELKRLNMEYKSKRDSGRLGAPSVKLVAGGSFDREKIEHIKRSGGRMEQYKHAYLSPLLGYCARFQLMEPGHP